MDKKSLIYSIIAVLLVAAIIAGGTFAYFQWTSGEDDRTSVNVTIEAGQITMHIEPETTVYTGLRPTNNCNNAVAYGDALATIVNNTGAMAIPSFKLSVKVTKNGTGSLTSDDLKHIHYSVVLLETNSNGTKGDSVLNEGSCSNPSNFTITNENIYFTGLLTGSATGTFETVSTEGVWSDLPNTENTYLPRQFNTVDVTPYGVTFLGRPHTTSYQWFRVYVWMDEGYTATNIGGVVSDPLQNAKIEVTWSANSMLEQVSSIISGGDENAGGEVKAAGLYDGDSFTSWDTLVANEDIKVSSGVITGSRMEYNEELGYDVGVLEGELVISNSITSIGDYALSEALGLVGVVIPNSVTTIGDGAFENTSLTSLVIPNSVTSIGKYAFSGTLLTSVVIPNSVTSIGNDAFWVFSITDVYYEGTEDEWNAISIGDYNDPLIDATKHYNYTG